MMLSHIIYSSYRGGTGGFSRCSLKEGGGGSLETLCYRINIVSHVCVLEWIGLYMYKPVFTTFSITTFSEVVVELGDLS